MIKRLRINWVCILKVLWATKKAYFVLFVNIMTFSTIGYVLFKKNEGSNPSCLTTFIYAGISSNS